MALPLLHAAAPRKGDQSTFIANLYLDHTHGNEDIEVEALQWAPAFKPKPTARMHAMELSMKLGAQRRLHRMVRLETLSSIQTLLPLASVTQHPMTSSSSMSTIYLVLRLNGLP